jgi:hypothetical protein
VNREPPDNELHYKRVQTTEAKLDLPDLQNGDEVEVEVSNFRSALTLVFQVKSELDGANRGQPLSISIVKQTPNRPQTQQAPRQSAMDSDEGDQEELLPPLNFEATILDPNSVKLEWRPNSVKAADEVFYVVNIKQLTTNSPGSSQDKMLRQQVS